MSERPTLSIPAVTYRLQLHGGFTFDDARNLVPYLEALGVTDCYCSPVFRSTPGSTHGYDVSRHTEFNPELGGAEAFVAFAEALRERRIGLLLDFVPNHMSNDPHTNDWWRDVLENGPSSPYARFFDIDWHPIKPELRDRLLLPILGEQYGETLERGLLTLRFEGGALVLAYGDVTLPINPRRAPLVYEHDLETLEQELGKDSPSLREFLSILTALRNLPAYTERDQQRILERQREKEVARERLGRLVAENDVVRAHIDRALAAFHGTPGDPRSFDRLHELLELQAYRLASWRTAADEINYRRFFDINQLAGLRVEDDQVFNEIHALVIELAAAGRITGVRLDHIDGLFDPLAYLQRLQAALAAATGPDRAPVYLLVEKILSDGEPLPAAWPVAGTTGYNFLNDLNGLFVDGRRAALMQRTYARFTSLTAPFSDVAYDSKRLIVSTALSSEFQVLVQAINRLSEAERRSRDFTLASIGRVLREVVACFPVYRTYVSRGGTTEADAQAVDRAISEARWRNPAMESTIFDFVRSILMAAPRHQPADDRAMLNVAMRVQQYTAPVQAKGIEDTAFYRYHVLASLNEVGGDPRRMGRSIAAFHGANLQRRRQWPGEMLATTTHDTKRSEDARARINVLSELPEAWSTAVSRWRRINTPNRTRLTSGHAPDANDEYLFYQALVGAWPIDWHTQPPAAVTPELVARLIAYMEKAIREAKRHTSWITPNTAYESAVVRFIEQSLTGATAPVFRASFEEFSRRIAAAGAVNGLAQLVLKIGSPGVADFYQGVELWDQSLVDPDNRRPVAFAHRQRLLAELEPALAAASVDGDAPPGGALAATVAGMLEGWTDGRIKLFLSVLGMRLRRSRPRLFIDGAYQPLIASGAAADRVIAFVRTLDREALIFVVPRLTTGLGVTAGLGLDPSAWRDTSLRLDDGTRRRFRNLVTGARLEADSNLLVSDVLRDCPVALLWQESAAPTT